jgi:hypothetical protein
MSSRFPSLCWDRAQGRGREPPRVESIGTRPPSRWVAPIACKTPAPRSKPVTHASRLVTHYAPSVACGRGVKIPAAGPAHLRLYSHLECLCARTSKSLARTFPRRSADSAGSRPHRRPPTLSASHDRKQLGDVGDRLRSGRRSGRLWRRVEPRACLCACPARDDSIPGWASLFPGSVSCEAWTTRTFVR